MPGQALFPIQVKSVNLIKNYYFYQVDQFVKKI
jgi:hypothetical protein